MSDHFAADRSLSFLAFMFRLCAFVPLVLVLAGACTDPASDLGADLVGGGQEPDVRPVAPVLFTSKPFADITGQSARVLAGMVDDPLTGSVTATAYMDFTPDFGGSAPDLVGASLLLPRTYAYGDTASMVTVAVHDILETWAPAGVKADTSLMLGPEVMTHTFLANDTLVEIPLPQEWVDSVADTLKLSNADSLFHGLALTPVSGGAVVGFVSTGTMLRVHSADDSTSFAFQKGLTTTVRLSDPMPPEHRIVMQDGTGPAVRIEFDLDAFASQPINGAVLLIYADTLAVQEVPGDFERPQLDVLQLVAVQEGEAAALLVSQARLSEEGIFAFSGGDMAAYFYRELFGLNEYEFLELRAPVLENSLNALVLHGLAGEDFAPELRLILGSK